MKPIRSLVIASAMVLSAVCVSAQPAPPDLSKSANPELIGELTKELGATPAQAEGAAGALFGLAQQKMPAADWAKVSGAVPGMASLIEAAPAAAGTTAGGAAAAGALAKAGGSLGAAAAAFSKLGLKPEMVAKAVPILTQYVTKTGGADVGASLASALK